MRYFIILLAVLCPNFVYGFMEDSLAIKGFRQFLTTSTYGGIYQYSSTPQNVFFVAQTDSLARYMIDTSRRAANKDVVIFVVAVREEFRGAFFETATNLSKIRASKETGGIKQIQKANENINAAYLREIKRHSKYLNKKIVLISKIETIFDNKPYSSNFASVSGISGLVPTSRMLTELKKSNNGEESKWLNENVSNILVLLNQCKGLKHTVQQGETLVAISRAYFLISTTSATGQAKADEKASLIASCNQIALNSLLSIGQQLTIPITQKERDELSKGLDYGGILPAANAEVIAVEKLGRDNNVVVNGLNLMAMTRNQAIDTLGRERPVVWHLVSHAVCGLLNRLATTSWYLLGSELQGINISTPPPVPDLVFLSSCQSGVGGNAALAYTFLRMGAKNSIGTIQSVVDAHAKNFAVEFYTNYFLINPTTQKQISEVLRQTQFSFLAMDNDIWYQYQYFGYKKTTPITLGTNEAKVEILIQNNMYKARITKSGVIKTIDLSTETDMNDEVIYAINARSFEYKQNAGSKANYDAVWGKIDLELQYIQTVYFIPEGAYNKYANPPSSKSLSISWFKDFNDNNTIKPRVLEKYNIITIY